MSAPSYTPATRDDLLPGAVFVVMNDKRRSLKCGTLVRIKHDDGSNYPFFYPIAQGDKVTSSHCFYMKDLAVHTPGATPEPLTSHAAAAAEIARLRGQVAALRGGLHKAAIQCDRWAEQSVRGSWSTHQVEPNRRLATELRTILAATEEPGT